MEKNIQQKTHARAASYPVALWHLGRAHFHGAMRVAAERVVPKGNTHPGLYSASTFPSHRLIMAGVSCASAAAEWYFSVCFHLPDLDLYCFPQVRQSIVPTPILCLTLSLR